MLEREVHDIRLPLVARHGLVAVYSEKEVAGVEGLLVTFADGSLADMSNMSNHAGKSGGSVIVGGYEGEFFRERSWRQKFNSSILKVWSIPNIDVEITAHEENFIVVEAEGKPEVLEMVFARLIAGEVWFGALEGYGVESDIGLNAIYTNRMVRGMSSRIQGLGVTIKPKDRGYAGEIQIRVPNKTDVVIIGRTYEVYEEEV